MREFAVAILGATLLWTASAGATGCRDWDRASPATKTAIVESMIHSAISGQRGREYQVNQGQTERCLRRLAQDIEFDLDDACADFGSTGMQALNHVFKNYIWSCIH